MIALQCKRAISRLHHGRKATSLPEPERASPITFGTATRTPTGMSSPVLWPKINTKLASILSAPSGAPGIGDRVTLTPPRENSPSSGNHWAEIVLELEQANQNNDTEYSRCLSILQGVGAAAKAGDDLGAANGLENYLKCLRYPKEIRPPKPTPSTKQTSRSPHQPEIA